jgi:polysaccharide deacetylase family protein (PEP-CTERM system associated)
MSQPMSQPMSRDGAGRIAHALSVDVEDWFQVLNLRPHVERADWDEIELRCGRSTERLLELFARHDARATFFFLGWVAERIPSVVRAVAAAGHEIGSHGYDHQLLDELGPEGFDEDLARTEAILEEITGERPTQFRACTWSITARTGGWALPTLARRGYRIDSSIFPVRHPDYGVPDAPHEPYRIAVSDRQELIELPPLTWRTPLGKRLPVGGGGYLRLFPTWFVERGLRQCERAGRPGCVYLHPWEIDPEQPRVAELRGVRRFRHYVNLERTASKLDRLLGRFRFVGLAEALAQLDVGRLRTVEMRALVGG